MIQPMSLPKDSVDELRSSLSEKASVLTPDDVSFKEKAQRWAAQDAPDLAAVVIVDKEQDIISTMTFAKSHKVPFFVSTARHGVFTTMTEIKSGIHISLERFKKVEVSGDGNSAAIGGGVTSKDVSSALWKKGKITVTGVCETVGMGLWLGGGHGILQGLYGLAADQVISARMILADGSIVTVSETSHPDLFWAIRGAGHNFGIVTELNVRIYDAKPHETWTYEIHFFKPEYVEDVFHALNEMKEREDPTAQYFAVVKYIPEINPEKPTLFVLAYASGTSQTTTLRSYTTPLHSLSTPSSSRHITLQNGEFSYITHAKLFDADVDGNNSRKGTTFLRHPVDIIDHNPTAVREVYDLFTKGLTEFPGLRGNSQLIFESYPVHRVQEIDTKSTAFPWRADHLLVSPFITYDPSEAASGSAFASGGKDQRLDEEAMRLSRTIQRVLLQGSGRTELHTYVNYANGEEDVESWYGFETWRLERLRELKGRYDPENLFRFYGRIVG